MKQNIADFFAKHEATILHQAGEQFGFDHTAVKRLGSFENFVFEFEANNQGRILRLTDSDHRHPDKIHGELEWINYLYDSGVPVSRSIESRNGTLVEMISVDGQAGENSLFFSAAVFEKASGTHARKEDWNEKLFFNWGELTGRMHRLAKTYQPSKPGYRRRDWRDDEDLGIDNILPPGHERVIERFHELLDRLQRLPMDDDSYGLIHVDFHQGNFFVHEGEITLFDFDDCHYDWFVNDIAIPLFYASSSPMSGDDPSVFARIFVPAFMRGYRREHDLDPFWFEQVPDFLKLREMLLYSVILAEEADKSNEWCRRYLDGRKERIEQGRPVVDADLAFLCR